MAWLSGYRYRKLVPITGQAGAGTDYQVPLTVHSGIAETTEEQTSSNAAYQLYSGSKTRCGQKLTISNRTVSTLTFALNDIGSPSGDVTFTIRAVSSNGYSADEVIVSKVWGDAGDLGFGVAEREVTFDTPVLINEEVRISCEFSGGDASNYVGISFQNTDVKASEGLSYYDGSWTDEDGNGNDYDLYYKYTYINDIAGVVGLLDYCTDFPNDIRFTDDDGDTELNHHIVATGDPTTFKIEIADDLDDAQNFYIYWGKSGAASGVSEFREDFLDYTEEDTVDDRLQRTGDPSHHIDFEAHNDEDVWLVKDKGADYFGSNWEHSIDIKPISAAGTYRYGHPWLLSNTVDDSYALLGETFITVMLGRWADAFPKIRLWERHGGSNYDAYVNAAFNTSYYLLLKKVGTSLKMGVYSTAALRGVGDATDGDVGNGAIATLQADHKFQYIFPANTYNSGTDRTFVMDIDNLLLRFIVDPEPVVGTPGSLEEGPVGRLVYGGLVNSGLIGGRLTG